MHVCLHSDVVYDDEVGVHYDVLLSKIDVNAGFYGLYNFYKMQVTHGISRSSKHCIKPLQSTT